MKVVYNKKGQGIIDFVVVFLVAIVVVIVMGNYVRNVLSGRMRDGADTIGGGEVYMPHVTGVSNPTQVVSDTITNSK